MQQWAAGGVWVGTICPARVPRELVPAPCTTRRGSLEKNFYEGFAESFYNIHVCHSAWIHPPAQSQALSQGSWWIWES